MEVFKIQKSLTDNNVLAYNKDRSIIGEFVISKELSELFGNELKIYVLGKYNENTKSVDIIKKVDEKKW